MVKYESGNGDLAVTARRRSPLNFAWPWLERRSVAAGCSVIGILIRTQLPYTGSDGILIGNTGAMNNE